MATLLCQYFISRIKFGFLHTTTVSIYDIRCIHLKKNTLRKTFYKNKEVKKIGINFLTRYIEYVKNYDKIIETKFPTAMHLYRTFKGGVKEFYSDLVNYVKIVRLMNTSSGGLKNLSLNEIELYHRMPRDMIKVAPVLFLSALPMTNYIIFPLTYYFPRQLLCSHFWTLQQRSEFQMYYLRNRLIYQRPTFRCMQADLGEVKKTDPLFKKWSRILGLLGSGVQPKTNEILECQELFKGSPYHLNYMKIGHVKHLLRMHGLSTSLWFRRSRLNDRAHLLMAMDKAIQRENGINGLSPDALKSACYIRGLNPINMKHDDMIQWLREWLEISNLIDNDSTSLLLHCPILLGYNQPNNWMLIYK